MKRFDYFSEYSYFTTDNKVPNNGYRNNTYAGRFGVVLGNNTDLSATLRAIDGTFGSPNGFALYGIADDSTSDTELLYGGVRAQSQWTDRLQTTIRYGSMGQTSVLQQPDADRTAVRSVRFRRQLPGTDGDAARRQRHLGDRPGDPGLRRRLPAAVREPQHAAHAVRPGHLPGDRRSAHLGRRPVREGGRLQRSRGRPGPDAQQRRRVRRGPRQHRRPHLHQRRPRRRAQRSLRDRRRRRDCRSPRISGTPCGAPSATPSWCSTSARASRR